MNIVTRLFKIIQSSAHSILSKFEDPVKLTEQGIRDLKKDFDESMKNVASVKAIAIGVKKDIDVKTQVAKDYQQKAIIILKKAQNGELDAAEADRLAGEALKKQKEALAELERLKADDQRYSANLEEMEKKVLQLKEQIKKWESEYASLKARATVAKSTKKINKQLAAIDSESTMAMLEDMKTKIAEEENLAEAYGQIAKSETNIDDEINAAIGMDPDVQLSLEQLKQQLLEAPKDTTEALPDDLEQLKKELNDQ